MSGFRPLATVFLGTIFTGLVVLLVVNSVGQLPCITCTDRDGPRDWEALRALGVVVSPGAFAMSTLLFLIPAAVGLFWAVFDLEFRPWRKILLRGLAILTVLSVIVDVGFLGATCFTFPNREANVGIVMIPMFDWTTKSWLMMPWEDLVFYIVAAALTMVLYAWLTLSFLRQTNEDYWPDWSAERVANLVRGGDVLECWHGAWFIKGHPTKPDRFWPSFKLFVRDARHHQLGRMFALVLCGLAGVVWIYGQFDAIDGTPVYAMYLLISAGVASYLLLGQVYDHLNWRAFALTAVYMALLSVVYEITLALPFGWWGFRESLMLGVSMAAWWDQPIEQLFIYASGTYVIVLIWEAVLLWDAWANPREAPSVVEIRAS